MKLSISKSSTARSDYDDLSLVRYGFEIVLKNGQYDDLNGVKLDYYPSGQVKIKCKLDNGKLVGSYLRFNESGDTLFFGNYIDGVENGLFKEYSIDGSLMQEYRMLEGKLNGNKIEYLFSENVPIQKRVIPYLMGKKNGKEMLLDNLDSSSEPLLFVNYKNDIKDGAFKELAYDDTLITGVYNMGKLDGHFELSAKRIYYDNAFTEINYWNKEREGEYVKGVSNGLWSFYTNWGAKVWEGNFVNGKKSGVWKHYVTVGNKYGSIMEELEFKDDVLDGLVKVYFEILEIEEEDSIRVFKVIPQLETSRYLSGVLNGKYEKLDSLNRVLEQGFYKLGKKFGKWTEVAHLADDRITPLIVCSGSYDNDEQRDGPWSYTEVKSNQVIIKINYSHGLYDGKTESYSSSGVLQCIENYNQGVIESLEIYDSHGEVLLSYSEILASKDGKTFSFRYVKKEDGVIQTVYYEANVPLAEVEYFNPSIQEMMNSGQCKKNGDFEIKNQDGKVIEKGQFNYDSYVGVWKFYDYGQNVIIQKNYSDDTEAFFNIDGQVFNGVYRNVRDSRIEEIKVKHGLRNGKTKIFSTSNNTLLRTEKYKNGILVN